MPLFTFEHSYWYIPLCVLLSAWISYLVYSKNAPWDRRLNQLLLVIRFVVFVALFCLLINPLLHYNVTEIEAPIIVLGIDNSVSISQQLDALERNKIIETLESAKFILEKNGVSVHLHSLNKRFSAIDSLLFDQKITNLDRWLKEIQSSYEGQHLAGVYLFSDGKYNQGISPSYFPYPFQLSTIGIGDTTQKQDISIQHIAYNKFAYEGNKFPVEVEVLNHGLQGQSASVALWNGTKRLANKKVHFNQVRGLQKVKFSIDATKSGMQQLLVKILPLADEHITVNNAQQFFVDVIDGKQKILIIAPAPHPDIKALAAVIERNKNYELHIHIPQQNELIKAPYDLIVVHQGYDKYHLTQPILNIIENKATPIFYIMGNQSDIILANSNEEGFEVAQKGTKRDIVFPSVNVHFSPFTLEYETEAIVANYPPLHVPYGDMTLPTNAHTLIYQKIGSITTTKPLLYTTVADERKSAYLLAEGIWKWRMQEFATTSKTEFFDELFLKLIQYMSTKSDKRKFRCFPVSQSYSENQNIQFQSEIYNDIYERVFDQLVKVEISGENQPTKSFSYTPASAYTRLEVGILSPGIYDYTASTIPLAKKLVAKGKFIVNALHLEQLDQVADFSLLRQVATKSNGKFYLGENNQALLKELASFQTPSIIHTHTSIFPLIHFRWICFLLIFILSTEWFSRKYNGGY